VSDELTEVKVEVDFAGPFTANELVEIEDLTGATLDQIGTAATGRCIRAVAWIIGRRTNPDLTLEEAGELQVRLDGRT
jgi:hypothetical protein